MYLVQEVDFAAANVMLLFCRSKLFTKLYQICIHYILFDVLGMYYVGIQFIIKPLGDILKSRGQAAAPL